MTPFTKNTTPLRSLAMYLKALLFQGIKGEIRRKEEKRENKTSGTKERAKKITRQKPTPAIAIDSSMQYE